MSKEKQIEEMAKIFCGMKNGCDGCMWDKVHCHERNDAEEIYNAGYRKQSEWISVEERLPEDVYGRDRKQITVLVCTKCGRVSPSSRVRVMQISRDTWELEYTDIFEWSGQIEKKVTHWMPLPEAPKGGAE
jgi:hypothetical protein